jgi:hypothetical protein
MLFAIASAKGRFDVPVKIFTGVQFRENKRRHFGGAQTVESANFGASGISHGATLVLSEACALCATRDASKAVRFSTPGAAK